jgi:hypothetical protein
MPAASKKQQMAVAVAEHAPDKLYSRNSGLLKMSKPKLSEFASTKRSNLPLRSKSSL